MVDVPLFTRFLYIPGGCLGYLPSTVGFQWAQKTHVTSVMKRLKRFQELLQIIHLVDERLPKDQAQTGAVGWLVGFFFRKYKVCVFFLEFLKEKHPPVIYVGLIYIYIRNGFHFST